MIARGSDGGTSTNYRGAKGQDIFQGRAKVKMRAKLAHFELK